MVRPAGFDLSMADQHRGWHTELGHLSNGGQSPDRARPILSIPIVDRGVGLAIDKVNPAV